MPLPFLTADRAFDATTDDVALPFDDHDQWRRPYRPGPWRVAAAALLLLLSSFVLLAGTVTAAAGSASGAYLCLALAAVGIAIALRLLRVGAWVSRHGVRRVLLLRTRTVAWDQVTEVRTVQQPVRWLGLPRTVQGQALSLVLRQGAPLPLLTDHNADFLSRTEAFDRAADTVEAWGDEYRRP
ncbi:PH domain-containing protein [Streptomyces liangshanensis]|uniref:PH domain-containing protein n=1 Tax=Streptomyces liangshanensis TaxID=2717324 RepID=A0A6G9GVQ5_9ACTN|nr:PH domain-containing protein [Streptomyces liangshanensis]QIQ02352.1 PH domain-containing protein [Streptomyces liangshanensis]